MDGYALRAADWSDAARLPVQQRCYAGDTPEPLKPGHAIRLFTGSLIPEGADVVVMQEDAEEADGHVRISRPPALGQHIRLRGEDTLAGAPLLAAGTVLEAAHVALLASQGMATAPARARLRVGIPDHRRRAGAARRARARTDLQLQRPHAGRAGARHGRRAGPRAACARHRGRPAGRVQDAAGRLRRGAERGRGVGRRARPVKPALATLGGELSLWKVRMKPGKPVALAQIGGKPVVSLPGNPVSAYAVFTLLVTPLVRRMQGRETLFPPVSLLPLRTERTRQDSREEFLRVQRRVADDGSAELVPYGHQGSGVISSLPWSTGLARVPADTPVQDKDRVPTTTCVTGWRSARPAPALPGC